MVNGSASLIERIAAATRRLQSGYLYHYAFAMILGLILLLGGVLAVRTGASGGRRGRAIRETTINVQCILLSLLIWLPVVGAIPVLRWPARIARTWRAGWRCWWPC